MIKHGNVFDIIPKLKDNSINTVFCDPPYNLSTKYIINESGEYEVVGKSNDFMSKWQGILPEQWKIFFHEAKRFMKHGGYIAMFGMEENGAILQYYAIRSGFEICQSMAWYNISGFPKSLDVSKGIDKIVERNDLFKPFAEHYKKQRKLKNITHNKICEVGKFYNNHNHGGASSNWENGENVPTLEQWNILQPLLNLDIKYSPLIERVQLEREILKREKMTIGIGGNSKRMGNEKITDKPACELSELYNGYKGGKKPLKPCLEIIYVFRKPLKTGAIVSDILASEKDNSISPACLNIDGGRVGTDELKTQKAKGSNGIDGVYNNYDTDVEYVPNNQGRYPSQLFTDTGAGELLDSQSGELTADSINRKLRGNEPTNGVVNWGTSQNIKPNRTDKAGCSKILHKCDYDKDELVFYSPKVSNHERNAGCDDMVEKSIIDPIANLPSGKKSETGKMGRNDTVKRNHHPTLKPMSMLHKVFDLFKLPIDNQKILIPFSGAGSEYISVLSTGVDEKNILAIEMTEEYIDISKARLEYWKKHDYYFLKDKKEQAKIKKDIKKTVDQLSPE